MIGAPGPLPSVSNHTNDAAFEAMYAATSRRVFAYARRHTDAEVALDIVSEVYLVAWRRRASLPDEVVPWLLVTARNVLASHWRSQSRQRRLVTHLSGISHMASLSNASPEERLAFTAAFERLSPEDAETLLLVGWDGLTPAQAAQVVGCSANAFAARLSRARKRLNGHVDPQGVHPRLVAVTTGEQS